MKVFLVTFLAAAAVAQPQWLNPFYPTGINTFHAATGLLGHPFGTVYNVPSVVQPVVQPAVQYVKEDKMPEIKMDKEDMKVKVYKKEEVKPVVYTSPFGHVVQPVVPELKIEVPPRYSVKNGKVENHLYKRDADAEPIWPLTYNNYNPFYSTYPYGLGYTRYMLPQVPQVVAAPQKVTYTKPVIESDAKTVANDAVSPFGYAEKGRYVADSEGALHVAKREAEADPAFLTYGAFGTHFTHPYSTYGINTGMIGLPYMYQPYVVPKVKTYSNDAVKPEDYASKNQYRAETEGSLHVAKRDAEADPAFLIGSPYSTFGRTVYSTPYVTRTLPYYNNIYNNYRYGLYY